jgi:hypothetical protein
VIALLTGSAAGCTHAQAKMQPELPPLDVPAPPPRVVEATEPVRPPQIALPEGPPTNVRTQPQPPPRADVPRSTEPPKSDQPPAEPPRVVEEPQKPSAPVTTLQTTPAQPEEAVQQRVEKLLSQASSDLDHVNIKALNKDARNQYDTARRFVSQAKEALRERNLVFASNLADKAAALAAQLPNR